MGKYFGTDGFRGEANDTLVSEHAYKIGRYLGRYYSKNKRAKIVVGKDTRISGGMLESCIAGGLAASGSDVLLLGIVTTPCVSYACRKHDFDCGIMITASHNPFYDNGIKLISSEGRKVESEVEAEIEKYLDDASMILPYAKRDKIGIIKDFSEGADEYLDYLASVPTSVPRGIKVGLDCANGSASDLAPKLFDCLGIETVVINNSPDGSNINERCGSTNIAELKELVKNTNLNAGFAFDGDADRLIAVDENGSILDGDRILYVCGKYLKENNRLKNSTVVTTVMSNLGLYKAFEKAGISSVKTSVGDKYVSEAMVRGGFSLGGEQSGHIIIGDYAPSGDGMLSALILMEIIAETGKSLCELTSGLTIYPQVLKNVRVRDKQKVLENERVKKTISDVSVSLGEEGRILVRKSGTEPLIRVMAEAENSAVCAEKVDCILKVIRSEGLEEV